MRIGLQWSGLVLVDSSNGRSVRDVWDRIIEIAAATFEREASAVHGLSWDPSRYRSIGCPTLHVSGGLTEQPIYPSHDEIASAIPAAEHAVIDGQRHVALTGDPNQFAETLLCFIRSNPYGPPLRDGRVSGDPNVAREPEGVAEGTPAPEVGWREAHCCVRARQIRGSLLRASAPDQTVMARIASASRSLH